MVELTQPLNATNSIMATYLQANGDISGIQHVTFDTGNVPMDERIKLMHEQGYEIGMEGICHSKKGQCRFVCFDTAIKGAGTCFTRPWSFPGIGKVQTVSFVQERQHNSDQRVGNRLSLRSTRWIDMIFHHTSHALR